MLLWEMCAIVGGCEALTHPTASGLKIYRQDQRGGPLKVNTFKTALKTSFLCFPYEGLEPKSLLLAHAGSGSILTFTHPHISYIFPCNGQRHWNWSISIAQQLQGGVSRKAWGGPYLQGLSQEDHSRFSGFKPIILIASRLWKPLKS